MSFKDKIASVAARLDHVRGRDGLGEEATKTAAALDLLMLYEHYTGSE